MKIGFDTILYIIIAIIIFVINILGKTKKNISHPVIGDSETDIINNDEYDLISSFENFFTPKEEQPQEVKKELISAKKEQEKKPESTIEIVERSTKDEPAIYTEKITSEKQEINTIINDFDLTEAVIYSEILNKKYF